MKQCIFDMKKICADCGECNICEYNKDKICDNCSKCLELEGYDVKAIKIDEVFDKNKETEIKIDIEHFSDFDTMESTEDFYEDLKTEENTPYIDALDNEDNWDYIDDIEGMGELLEDLDSDSDISEQFPGLYVLHKR
ncbi:hypothetical protein [Clostridium sp.]|uniref:hypothetical protein n=1 Tax=Clostridium sp. TaxID=1506 RepID=UPI003218018E